MGDNEKSIRIYVALKHMGNLTKKIKTYPLDLAKTPQTFRELVEESVRSCIASYKARAENANNPQPLSDEVWSGMQEIGKFAFGVHYNENDKFKDARPYVDRDLTLHRTRKKFGYAALPKGMKPFPW